MGGWVDGWMDEFGSMGGWDGCLLACLLGWVGGWWVGGWWVD